MSPLGLMHSWRVAGIAILAAGLVACGKEPRQEQFVGRWQSSRLATAPLLLHKNGEWEIRATDRQVMQYGLWRLQGQRLIWTIKQGDQLQHDANAILQVEERRFELRESDGSVTRFERLD